MDGKPRWRAPLIHDHHFTDDELAVAAILVRLKTLIPLYDPSNRGLLSPGWGLKRPRSTSASPVALSPLKSDPGRIKRESAVPPPRPDHSAEVNLRNVSPDSPLLLKSSPNNCDGQGSVGIGAGHAYEKTERRKHGRSRKAELESGIKRCKKPKKEIGGRNGEDEASALPLHLGVTLSLCGLPSVTQLMLARRVRDPNRTTSETEEESKPSIHGALISSASLSASRPLRPFDIDLNLSPPNCTDAPSTPQEEKSDRRGLPPSEAMVLDEGTSRVETAKAARQRRLEICRVKHAKPARRVLK